MTKITKEQLHTFMIDVLGYDMDDAKEYGWDDFSEREQEDVLAYHS